MIAVIAIDGPVGVGKTSVARRVSELLEFRHIDTGAMYRAVAWHAMNLPTHQSGDPAVIGQLARDLVIDLRRDGSVIVDGQDLTSAIRDEAVSRAVALVADLRPVREALVDQQRRLGREQPSVLEGRDIGTVVFPTSACKIYLDASPKIRVERRVAQLTAMGKPADREAIHQALIERDERDRSRAWGSLKLADDARLIDTTYLDEDNVVELICSLASSIPIFERHLAPR